LVATLAVTLVANACASTETPTSTISLVARDIAYDPGRIVATVGEPIEIAMRNVGAIDHDLNVEGIKVREVRAQDATTGGHGHGASPAPVHVAASPGRTATVRFVPTEAGTFEVWCSVPGHREAGMVAILEVRPSAAGGAPASRATGVADLPKERSL
jgi:uncharacterized cupredoxin-like copper-binding protein